MKLRFIAPLILLVLFSCSDGEGLMHSQGLLLGSEEPRCSCCPEDINLIKIKGKIYRYHHEELPDGFRGFLNVSDIDYPIEVELSWRHKNNQCPKNEILITEIDLAD